MENERCKDCEHCEYYINASNKQNKGPSAVILFFVLLVGLFYGAAFYAFYQENMTLKVRVYENEIGGNCVSDFLDDELLEQ